MTAAFTERVDAARRFLAAARTAPAPPVGLLDQARAASTEARAALNDIGDIWETIDPGIRRREGTLDGDAAEAAARILAVLPEAALCPHLRRGGPQPGFYRLDTRRLTCRRCHTTVVRPVVAANECDLCRQPADTFTEFAVALGAVIVMGNAGACCTAPGWPGT